MRCIVWEKFSSEAKNRVGTKFREQGASPKSCSKRNFKFHYKPYSSLRDHKNILSEKILTGMMAMDSTYQFDNGSAIR